MNLRGFLIRTTVTEKSEFYFHVRRCCLALILFLSPPDSRLWGQAANETLLSAENAYNPIPSPNGKMIAYVRTGWGRPGGSGGFGRSNLISEVVVITDDGKPITATPLTDTFLAGWTPHGSALVCYRDWKYTLISLNGKRSLQGDLRHPENVLATERVFYLPGLGAVAWSRVGGASNTVLETQDQIIAEHPGWLGDVVVPSPDGRYLAVFGDKWRKHLWVYDMQFLRWSDLGPLTVHLDDDWDYLKATWNPWFADSSHLAYFSGTTLVISEPDGNGKRTIPMEGHAALATPSPGGKSVAYVTSDPRPRNFRPDLQFWGGTVIWILPLAPGGKPYSVTEKNPATTYDLRWLGADALVFDRFDDEAFPRHARMWRVAIPRASGPNNSP